MLGIYTNYLEILDINHFLQSYVYLSDILNLYGDSLAIAN